MENGDCTNAANQQQAMLIDEHASATDGIGIGNDGRAPTIEHMEVRWNFYLFTNTIFP
jgi:hypothetical protein